MARELTDKQKEIIEHMYCDIGVSIKNIVLYFTENNQIVNEKKVAKYLRSNNMERKLLSHANVGAQVPHESIHSRAHRLLDSVVARYAL